MEEPWFCAVWSVGAYLLGSVSLGDLVARAAGADIRSLGTGNPGAANVYREVGPAYGVAVFLLDVAKGATATAPLLVLGLPAWSGLLAMAAVIAGHIFPVLWGFRGGTGMAVAMGASAGLLPLGALIAMPPALIALRLTRNAGYTGAFFFTLAILVGWLVYRDIVGVTAILLGGAAVLIKALVQYRER